jgi:hypothetical protein
MIARPGFPLKAHPGAVRGQPPVACNPREPSLRVSQTSPYRGRPCNCQHPVFPGLGVPAYGRAMSQGRFRRSTARRCPSTPAATR